MILSVETSKRVHLVGGHPPVPQVPWYPWGDGPPRSAVVVGCLDEWDKEPRECTTRKLLFRRIGGPRWSSGLSRRSHGVVGGVRGRVVPPVDLLVIECIGCSGSGRRALGCGVSWHFVWPARVAPIVAFESAFCAGLLHQLVVPHWSGRGMPQASHSVWVGSLEGGVGV